MPLVRGATRKHRRQLARIADKYLAIAANEKAGTDYRILGHEYDQDAICIHCDYDGAEGIHLKNLGYGPEEYGPINHCEVRMMKGRIGE